MFKASFACSFIAAQALAVSFDSPFASLAQTAAAVEEGCCCSVQPCMPKCPEPCAEPAIPDLPPMVPENIPPPMKEFLLNMDTIVNHIYHEIKPTIPDPPAPLEPNSDGDAETYIQTVVTPMIMELMVNDIAPVLPLCTYPGGGQFYIEDHKNPNATVPDGDEVLLGALDAMLDNPAMTADPNAREILESLDPAQIVADLTAADGQGTDAVEIIIAGANGGMAFKESKVADDLTGSGMQYNDKSESTKTAKRLDSKVADMTAVANAEGKAATELERMAVKEALGDEFTEKKFREMKQFEPEAVADAVAKNSVSIQPVKEVEPQPEEPELAVDEIAAPKDEVAAPAEE